MAAVAVQYSQARLQESPSFGSSYIRVEVGSTVTPTTAFRLEVSPENAPVIVEGLRHFFRIYIRCWAQWDKISPIEEQLFNGTLGFHTLSNGRSPSSASPPHRGTPTPTASTTTEVVNDRQIQSRPLGFSIFSRSPAADKPPPRRPTPEGSVSGGGEEAAGDEATASKAKRETPRDGKGGKGVGAQGAAAGVRGGGGGGGGEVVESPKTRWGAHKARGISLMRAALIDQAAITIQRFARGKRSRDLARYLRLLRIWEATMTPHALKIQSFFRGCKGRVRAGFLKSIKSYQALRFVKATLIQSHWRRVVAVQNLQLEYVIRGMLKVRRDAALEIERVYRGHCGRLVAKEEKTQIVFRWIWDGPGQSVELVGDFTDMPWQDRLRMRWCNIRSCYVRPWRRRTGRYEFKFLVNGQFVCDGSLPVERDEFGNVNNVIEIRTLTPKFVHRRAVTRDPASAEGQFRRNGTDDDQGGSSSGSGDSSGNANHQPSSTSGTHSQSSTGRPSATQGGQRTSSQTQPGATTRTQPPTATHTRPAASMESVPSAPSAPSDNRSASPMSTGDAGGGVERNPTVEERVTGTTPTQQQQPSGPSGVPSPAPEAVPSPPSMPSPPPGPRPSTIERSRSTEGHRRPSSGSIGSASEKSSSGRSSRSPSPPVWPPPEQMYAHGENEPRDPRFAPFVPLSDEGSRPSSRGSGGSRRSSTGSERNSDNGGDTPRGHRAGERTGLPPLPPVIPRLRERPAPGSSASSRRPPSMQDEPTPSEAPSQLTAIPTKSPPPHPPSAAPRPKVATAVPSSTTYSPNYPPNPTADTPVFTNSPSVAPPVSGQGQYGAPSSSVASSSASPTSAGSFGLARGLLGSAASLFSKRKDKADTTRPASGDNGNGNGNESSGSSNKSPQPLVPQASQPSGAGGLATQRLGGLGRVTSGASSTSEDSRPATVVSYTSPQARQPGTFPTPSPVFPRAQTTPSAQLPSSNAAAAPPAAPRRGMPIFTPVFPSTRPGGSTSSPLAAADTPQRRSLVQTIAQQQAAHQARQTQGGGEGGSGAHHPEGSVHPASPTLSWESSFGGTRVNMPHVPSPTSGPPPGDESGPSSPPSGAVRPTGPRMVRRGEMRSRSSTGASSDDLLAGDAGPLQSSRSSVPESSLSFTSTSDATTESTEVPTEEAFSERCHTEGDVNEGDVADDLSVKELDSVLDSALISAFASSPSRPGAAPKSGKPPRPSRPSAEEPPSSPPQSFGPRGTSPSYGVAAQGGDKGTSPRPSNTPLSEQSESESWQEIDSGMDSGREGAVPATRSGPAAASAAGAGVGVSAGPAGGHEGKRKGRKGRKKR
ncbi:unnamed protein product [Vitrella brassicaformis CCMP3155]|uniref:AMP-activated protein kinase glycogen-binding domain-containing protein n=2 Tax=Vitrella brassicaformis TaxID=1169539 RepID=A0A0G4GS03_VITBC|nr:unnamed protein product [Vitrella brassicaformis CCMP3155]|eukprot:CEM33392.1 unnamed protein product [Vitrella brassicaformis CCMP3155]